MRKRGLLLIFSLAVTAAVTPQAQPAQQKADPELKERPPAPTRHAGVVAGEGRIGLDVVVTDAAGKRVSELQPWDFKVLDNGQPRKILTFRAYRGTTMKPDPPVEIILVLDTVNLPFSQLAFVRDQLEQFLRQGGGRLKQPVLLVLFTDAGLRLQQRPTLDGNAEANVVKQIKGNLRAINPAMGGEGMVEQFVLSAHQLASIAENEALRPGRKLLIWVGPGWPMLNRPSDVYSDRDHRRNFEGIVELWTKLREARMPVYSVSPASDGSPDTLTYQNFLKPVRTWREAESSNLALKVLATQSGGLVLGPDNDLVGQIARCVEDADGFYRLSFDSPPAAQPDEYHELQLLVDKPGAMVRTTIGYYDQPLDKSD
jgi:VWFA-related protein